ncbi:MAG: hypothetical protein AAF596_06755 [Planctomycetota bacterium]
MNQRRSFYRKIAYGGAMAVLLIFLSMLSLPSTYGKDDGGKLAELRNKYELSQGNLGEVDPASETIKLATLGLRGIAVQRLWAYAFEMKKTENWSEFSATLELLAKLQPNFITFWKYQSWNVSYNVSVEFDDYRDRYYYVRRGIEFLKRGQNYNRDSPDLLWELGWFIGQKIGRADEKKQYRRLFKADDDYHNPEDRPPGQQRDNWVVSRRWYEDSVVAADEKGRGIGRKSPVIFYSSPAKSQMNYGEAIEEEGLFRLGRLAWKKAAEMWRDFGNLEIEHSTGVKMRLNDEQYLGEKTAELRDAMEALAPGTYEKIEGEARAKLTDDQREAIETAPEDRTREQQEKAFVADQLLRINVRDVANRIAEEKPDARREALALASEIEDAVRTQKFITNYKDICNFDYWMTRADFEQTNNAVEARELIYRGWRAFVNDSDPITAQELFEEGFRRWRAVLDEFPQLWSQEGTTGDDLMVDILRYNTILEQLDERVPDDFPLWEIIENFDIDRELEGQLRAYQQRQRERAAADPESDEG